MGLFTNTMRFENFAPNGSMLLTTNGDFTIASHGNFAFHVDDNLKVGIGTVLPTHELHVIGSVDITGEFTAASDARLKKDVSPISNALESLDKLNPVSYHFKREQYPTLKLADGKKMGLLLSLIHI